MKAINGLILAAVIALASPVYGIDVTIDYGPPAKAEPARVAKWEAKGKPVEYQKCLEYVQTVGDCLLCVGMPKDFAPKAYYTAFAVDKLDGFPAGVYLCSWPDTGKPPRMDRQTKYEPQAAPEVRSIPTFPGVPATVRGGLPDGRVTVTKTGSAVADHLCPRCGTGPWYEIAGFNADGTHNHWCPNCRQMFSH